MWCPNLLNLGAIEVSQRAVVTFARTGQKYVSHLIPPLPSQWPSKHSAGTSDERYGSSFALASTEPPATPWQLTKLWCWPENSKYSATGAQRRIS